MKFLMEGKSWPEPAQKDSTVEPNLPLKDVFAEAVPASSTEGLKMRSTMALMEQDPNGIEAKQPGSKMDAGKPDVLRGAIQYFPKALAAVARVSELGAKKYSWKGWQTVPNGIERYGAALVRHLSHGSFDHDAGPGGLGADTLHAAQVAWNALARLELILKELDEDYHT